MDPAERASLLKTADRYLRRTFGTYDANGTLIITVDGGGNITAPNISGLTTFANNTASRSQNSPITINSQQFGQTRNQGVLTMPREIWLEAAEDLLADPSFNPQAPARAARVIYPDYRYLQTV